VTDRPADALNERQVRDDAFTAVLDQAVRRARWTIFWERLWPALATVATAVGLFLALSWLGLWLWLPPIARAIGLFLLLGLIVASAAPLLFVRFPTKADALRRLDKLSGIVHRPATAVADTLATPVEDPLADALWQAHVERAMAAARALKAGIPTPKIPLRDPYAVRAAVLVLAVAAFFGASGERWSRIGAAFDWRGVVAPKNFRVDAWVTPPPYTARPPILLPGIRPGEPAEQPQRASTEPLSVPVGSTLVVRATGSVQLDLATKGGLEAAKGTDKETAKRPVPGAEEHRFTISGDGSATLRGVIGRNVTWSFQAVPDKTPVIALTKEPERQQRGSLRLLYKVEDDYGVVNAQATFARKPHAKTDAAAPRPLFGPPEMALSLPQARTRKGAGQTIKDLTEHPWAGTEILMTLVARDDAGNEGRSEPHAMRLPERVFVKPLARALIEQRRNLALDAEARGNVLVALEALGIAPDKFEMPAGAYLGLRTIYWKLGRAKNDDELRDVVARLWSMAIGIEDGYLSDVEKALRAAQDALREALERGASEEELKKLMDQLRAAIDRYMKALAEQMRRNPDQMARPLDPNARMLRPQDLRSMLDRMEKLARSGNRDAARRMLDQLQQMLENLQMARPGGAQDGDDDMMSALDQLGEMIRRQQQLRDRTFREGQNQRGARRRGQRGNQGQLGDLQRDQQGLRDQLQKLLEQLRQYGLGQRPGQQGEQGDGMGELGRAGREMGRAQGQLGEGDADGAVGSQGRALEALRRGAQGMAQAMQQGQGQGPGPGQPGRFGRARADQETDPLGRPLRGRDYGDDSTVKVPGEIDVQRARRILEELRRRYGETFRPQLELEYIERLLKDF